MHFSTDRTPIFSIYYASQRFIIYVMLRDSCLIFLPTQNVTIKFKVRNFLSAYRFCESFRLLNSYCVLLLNAALGAMNIVSFHTIFCLTATRICVKQNNRRKIGQSINWSCAIHRNGEVNVGDFVRHSVETKTLLCEGPVIYGNLLSLIFSEGN